MAKLSNEEALRMQKQLEEHYNEPVLPVSAHCDKLWKYVEIARPYLESRIDVDELELVISKSACLLRMLYYGEEPRTVPCPVHKGHWSGINGSDDPAKICECTARDGNITGWLPSHPDHKFKPKWVGTKAFKVLVHDKESK
jgi:hypothetical protein